MCKTCIKCNLEYPVSHFYKDSSRKDGLSPYCRKCKKKGEKEYWQKNKDRINYLRREATKKRTPEQRKHANELHKKYLQQAIDDPIKYAGAAKRLIRYFTKTNYRRSGIKCDKKASEITELLYKKYIEKPYCPFTGVSLKLQRNMSLDHIIPYSRRPDLLWDVNNLQWTSKEYNYHKKDKTPQEFYEFCLKVVKAGPQPI